MADPIDARRASFLSAGAEYERIRPDYPAEAVEWVAGDGRGLAVDLGCGPGKLSVQLIQTGHDVVGLDPSLKMLQRLQAKRSRAICGTAEAIPLRNSVAKVVTAAQAFHWFNFEQAVPEMRRILVPGGRVGLLWNLRDEDVEWVASLSRIIGSEDAMSHTLGPPEDFAAGVIAKLRHQDAFEAIETATFEYQQELTEEGLLALVRSRSYVAILSDEQREKVLADVRRLCREHPQLRDVDVFTLPYVTTAFRGRARP